MAFSEEHALDPQSIERLLHSHFSFLAYSFKISHYAWEEEDYGISKSEFMIIGSSQRMNKIDSISFKIDNMDLDEVSSFKYLGIVINNRLTWQDHVDQMFSKINKRVVKRGSRSRFTENKTVLSQFTTNKIGTSRFTEKKGKRFYLNKSYIPFHFEK